VVETFKRSQPTLHIVAKFILARAITTFTRLVIVQAAQRTKVSDTISTTGTACHDMICDDGAIATTFNHTNVVVTTQTFFAQFLPR
jgi:hypothetical protein